ncbi:MAG: hypothetical protein BGO07_00120 [Alphaproteobacteria bacterium 40-19]|nr:MAG: hypothetical protein BGO07_00120 [Alphaproteobacteria bacterium 40-19]
MIRKIVLLSLLSTVIPLMRMQQQFSKTTNQQEYSEEDYKNFIQSNYLTTEPKPTKFFQGFINFIKNKSLLDQTIVFTNFVYALTATPKNRR